MLQESEQLARALLGRFDPGDRVGIWAPNLPEWGLLQFGFGLAGLISVPLNPAYRQQELTYALRQSGASGIFYVPELRGNPMAEWVETASSELPSLREAISFVDLDQFAGTGSQQQALPEVSPDDPAQIQYTSGTTGAPKGAILHHRGLTNNGRFVVEGLGVEPGEAYLNPAPLFHVAGGVVGLLGSLACRAKLVQPEVFEPGLVLELIESESVVAMGGVPTMLIALMEHPDFDKRDLSSLRRVGIGGATVPAELVRSIEAALGTEFIVLFGQTEASCSIMGTRPGDSPEDKAETIGVPLPQTEVRIVDPETGDVVEPGTAGEICARGYGVMHGYYEDPEATAATIDSEGWLHTGDLGSMDDRGYCKIVGRLKDMIIRGGENIYPREIEEVIFAHNAVGDVAVVGIPDEKWGEQVAAFVRLAPGAQVTEDELHTYVRERLAPHKTPREWVFLEELPMTASGKVQKFTLREQFVIKSANPPVPTSAPAEMSLSSWRDPINIRWALSNTGFLPTVMVPRSGPVHTFESGPSTDVEAFEFEYDGQKGTLLDALYGDTTDGYLVIKDGKILYERYFDGFDAHDHHLWASATKSVTSMAFGILKDMFDVDEAKSPAAYVPELAGSAFDECSILQILNMVTGLSFTEDYHEMTPGSVHSEYFRRLGLVPDLGLMAIDPLADDTPRGVRPMLTRFERNHAVALGTVLEYQSPNVDVIGWLIERVSGLPLHRFVQQHLWGALQTEHDAFFLTDLEYAPIATGGLNTTLRDAARFGVMALNDGRFSGSQVVPESYVNDTYALTEADKAAWERCVFADPQDPRYQPDIIGYRRFWWILDDTKGERIARGVHGQSVYVNKSANVVIATFASPVETSNSLRPSYKRKLRGSRRLAASL
ncbi:MAG: AMP-binding protein [Actinomycetia bacterium]|nr:AMP-binding protein [Actinomycetes bacterium]